MPTLEELRPDLLAILREHPDQYWHSYQVFERLRERNPALARALEEEHGSAMGNGGGHAYGPASRIAQCLGRWSEDVDVQRLRTRGLVICGYEPPAEEMAVFRWTGR